MIEKRRCPNCGAYLKDTDKECYVCGTLISDTPSDEKPFTDKRGLTHSTVFFEAEQGEDFVIGNERVEPEEPPKKENTVTLPDDLSDAFGDNYDPNDYYEDEDDPEEKRSIKKLVIICVCCVLAAALIAGTFAFLWFKGFFSPEKNDPENITIYFDKPSASTNLLDSNGKVYSWSGDVEICYSVDGKKQFEPCSPCEETDNLWRCALPKDSESVYFYQSAGDKLRTQELAEVSDKTVYYITQVELNSELELPVASVSYDDFINIGGYGVNAAETVPETTAEATTKPTEKATEASTAATETTVETTAPTEKPTTADSGQDKYTISVPSSWKSGTTVLEKGNCTTYYETYNYKMYGSGMLLSVYVFDANDNSYKDLNVKKIVNSADGSKKIVAVTPSDIQFADSDEDATEKYIALEKLTNQVISSIAAQ